MAVAAALILAGGSFAAGREPIIKPGKVARSKGILNGALGSLVFGLKQGI